MEKEDIKAQLPISQILTYYGARPTKSTKSYHCFRHNDKNASLIADDRRGVATCLSPKCDIKRGSDVFQIIKMAENCDFQEAKNKALQMIGKFEPIQQSDKNAFLSKRKKEESRSFDVPKLQSLQERHIAFLKERFGKEWAFVRDYFNVQAYYYHIAIPINEKTFVFVPLNKQSRENPKGDVTYYRGEKRGCQVFPNRPKEQKEAKYILVCEGEKDVMKATAEIHKKRLEGWAVITNTIGAGNLKKDTPLFDNFDPQGVKKIIICYDRDEAGEQANIIASENAKNYFSNDTQVRIVRFAKDKPKGYDISDYLNEKNSQNSFINTQNKYNNIVNKYITSDKKEENNINIDIDI